MRLVVVGRCTVRALCRVEAKVNFWDLAGHPEFFEVRNEFYKDTQGVRPPPDPVDWCYL